MEKRAGKIQPLKAIAAALVTALAMKLFLFDFMISEGRSMLPAIRPGALLLINRAAYGLRFPWAGRYVLRWKQPETGDIVVFKTPLGQTAVKRCAAVEEEGVFALGDNTGESLDSRSYGFIQCDEILGKVVGIR
ncbi:MAG: signal peptidase I [Spirochaetaceae bacterium]|jgi:signal peptidase I|nr:signal peptidase I [Spirochaetaceae bacterium]